jgi:Tfp pilus assembly protein FimV
VNQETVLIETMRSADKRRLERMAREQPPVTREAWDKQVKIFEAAGRDTASSLPFWKRWWKTRK